MHILTVIIWFIIASIIAAGEGDFSGLAAIGKFIGWTLVIIGILWMFTQPVILAIFTIIAIVVLVYSLGSNK